MIAVIVLVLACSGILLFGAWWLVEYKANRGY
jgi:hypothetical protein